MSHVTTWAVRVVAHNHQCDTVSKTMRVKTNDYATIDNIIRKKMAKKGYMVTFIGSPLALR